MCLMLVFLIVFYFGHLLDPDLHLSFEVFSDLEYRMQCCSFLSSELM